MCRRHSGGTPQFCRKQNQSMLKCSQTLRSSKHAVMRAKIRFFGFWVWGYYKARKGHLPMSFLLSSRFLYRAVFYRQHAYSRAAYYIYRKSNNAKVNADSEACYVDFYTRYYNKLNCKCRYRCYNRQHPTNAKYSSKPKQSAIATQLPPAINASPSWTLTPFILHHGSKNPIAWTSNVIAPIVIKMLVLRVLVFMMPPP